MENIQPTYAVTKTHVECYKLRRPGTGDGWADITLDVNGNAGRIQIASDYGSWEHYWGSCGCPFKEFLINLSKDIHYAAGKFGEGKWFDQEATMADMMGQNTISPHARLQEDGFSAYLSGQTPTGFTFLGPEPLSCFGAKIIPTRSPRLMQQKKH